MDYLAGNVQLVIAIFEKNSIIIAKSFEEFLNCLEENPDD